MADPKVSIVIPVYNREHVVRRAIESAISQTYTNIEVVVVDNASSDNTYSVIREYAKRDPRVRCYKNETNIGPLANWQRCVELSQGEYVKILFSDEWMDDFTIERLIKPLLCDLKISFTQSRSVHHPTPNSPPRVVVFSYPEGYANTLDFLFEYAREAMEISQKVGLSPSIALFRRNDILSAVRSMVPLQLPGFNCDRYGVGNDTMLMWHCCQQYPYIYFVSDIDLHTHVPETDEPSITNSFCKAGKWNCFVACRRLAFAHFLATSSIPEKWKQILQTALFVGQNLSLNPIHYTQRKQEFKKLFPSDYHCCTFKFLDKRILKVTSKRVNNCLRRNMGLMLSFLPEPVKAVLRLIRSRFRSK